LTDYAKIEDVIIAQPSIPLAKLRTNAPKDRFAGIQFDPMTLAIVKANCFYVRKSIQCPREAGR
jgi:hypothetical protein